MYRAGNDGHDYFNTGSDFVAPVCNGVFSQVDSNIYRGWFRGRLPDGMPYCAEKTRLNTAEGQGEWMTFILPLMPNLYKASPDFSAANDMELEDEMVETEWHSILCEGMEVLGQVIEPAPLFQHVEYLEKQGIIRFLNDEKNGILLRLMDYADRPITAVVIQVKDHKRTMATSTIPWQSFGPQKQKNMIPQVKVWWLHGNHPLTENEQ